MLRKYCVSSPTSAAHTNTNPTWLAMYGNRMNSPEAMPTPAATTPGPTIRQVDRGGRGKSRSSGAGRCRVGKASTTDDLDVCRLVDMAISPRLGDPTQLRREPRAYRPGLRQRG